MKFTKYFLLDFVGTLRQLATSDYQKNESQNPYSPP